MLKSHCLLAWGGTNAHWDARLGVSSPPNSEVWAFHNQNIMKNITFRKQGTRPEPQTHKHTSEIYDLMWRERSAFSWPHPDLSLLLRAVPSHTPLPLQQGVGETLPFFSFEQIYWPIGLVVRCQIFWLLYAHDVLVKSFGATSSLLNFLKR